MVAISSFLLVLAGSLSVQATYPVNPPRGCSADYCFRNANIPAWYKPIASAFCEKYIGRTPGTKISTVTRTATSTVTRTPGASSVRVTSTSTPPATTVVQTVCVTNSANTNTQTSYSTVTTTVGVLCTVTSETTLGTTVNYPSVAPQMKMKERAAKPAILAQLRSGCSSRGLEAKISSACSCFLTSRTTTTTTTKTVGPTVTAPAGFVTISTGTTLPVQIVSRSTTVTTQLPESSATVTSTVDGGTTQSCTSTTTQYTYVGEFTCGIPSPTTVASGSITCSQDQTPPGETNAPFRIEGSSAEGTIYEGCQSSGPEFVTTPSGGTRKCDGTNNNANPSAGGTFTTQIDASGREKGFDFDGTYSNSFQDFFITRISATTQSGSQFWGLLRNLVFTARGGCQEQIDPFDEALWAFDAFAPNRVFLKLDPQYAVVEAGTESVTITVQQVEPNGGSAGPAQGAVVGGASTPADANGNIQVTVPSTPGCYQYKAEKTNAIRSNAFYLTVLPPQE